MMGPRIWSLAALVALLFCSSAAEALQVSTNVRREVEKQRLEPMTLSRADCSEGNGYIFRLTDIAISQPISVWGSQTTCTQQDRTMGICTEVRPGESFTVMAVDEFVVKPEPIANILPFVEGCEPAEVGAPAGSSTVNLFFFENLASNPAAMGIQQTITVDVVGPRPPSGLSVGVGSETSVTIQWAQSSPDQAADVNGYRVYCYPPPAAPDPTTTTTATTATTTTAGAGGAQADMHVGGGGAHAGGMGGEGLGGAGGAGGVGLGGAGGVPATTTTTGATTTGVGATTGAGGGADCNAGTLEPGAFPPVDMVVCAQVSATSTSALVSGLTFGENYAFAVSAIDRVENAGPFSEVVCGETEPTIDFFEAYRAAGGQGGGGCGCSVVGATATTRWALYLSLAGGLILALRRRRNA